MTVGDLRELIVDLPDETPIVVPDQAYAEFYPGFASVKILHYARISEAYHSSPREDGTIPTIPVRTVVLG